MDSSKKNMNPSLYFVIPNNITPNDGSYCGNRVNM